MADAIIPVPIYDPRYVSLANLVLNAKTNESYEVKDIPYSNSANASTSSIYFTPSSQFNIGIIYDSAAAYSMAATYKYYQVLPFIVIMPNTLSCINYTGDGDNWQLTVYYDYSKNMVKVMHSFVNQNQKTHAVFKLAILE